MKNYIHFFLLLIIFHKSYSQELFGQKETVEITKTVLMDNSEFKNLERKDIKIFDKKGRLVREIEFGFHHNRNLNLIGEVRSYLYKKNKLISEKTYSSGTDFENNQALFYWNYVYDKSRLIKINSNHSSNIYSYDKKNKIVEWIETMNWDSTNRKYFKKYDKEYNIIEEGEYNNWSKKFLRNKDSLKIIKSSYNYPKKADTTKTYINEVYKKGKIVYRKENNIYTSNYIYSKNDQLKSTHTRIDGDKVTDVKSEMIYYPIGIIKNIERYEQINDNWILKQKIDFEIKGDTSVFCKKEIERINQELIEEQKNF